jgi:hypothetical protein
MRRFALVAAIAVLLVACSGTSSDTVTTELAAPVADTVPSDWITYTDETSGISLSYPNDWEVFTLDEAAAADLFDSLEDAVPEVANAAIVFQAGLPTSIGFDPNVTVVVEVLPVELTVDEYVEASQVGLKQAFASYESTERVKTVVAGREVVLVPGSYDISEVDPNNNTERFWMIQLHAIDGRTGWGVTCGDASAVEPDLEVCDAIVRTFELSSS